MARTIRLDAPDSADARARASPQLKFFRYNRTTDGDACVQPSQCRYVGYLNQLRGLKPAEMEERLRGQRIRLLGLTISSAPAAIRATNSNSRAAAAATTTTTAATAATAATATATPAATVATAAATASDSGPASATGKPPPTTTTAAAAAAAATAQWADDALESVGNAINTVAASWHLRLDLANVKDVEAADGVSSGVARVATLPQTAFRCDAGSGPHTFEIPGGLVVCGELRLSLLAVSALAEGLLPPDELGWLHVHTGFLPPDSSEHALQRVEPAKGRPSATSPDYAATASSSSPSVAMTGGPPLSWMDADDLSVCTATFSKGDVDLVDRDHRFPRDWRLTLHYRHERDGGAASGLGGGGGGGGVPCVGKKAT